jgi:hypothetical protein
MPIPSFRAWLEHRPQEVPDVASLALLIARSGAAGAAREDLRRAVRLSNKTLEDVLRGLVTSGQVQVVSVNGQLRYRAAG